MYRFFSIILFIIPFICDAQSVGIGTTAPNTTAVLDITSSTKGVLIPRLTISQRNAISSPATGLLIYNTTDKQYNFFNGINWQILNGLPKGAMVLSYSSNDTLLIKEGFVQEGFLTHDMTKLVYGDTTIPANNWYAGNRRAYQNAGAPSCSPFFAKFIAGYAGNDLYVFTYDGNFGDEYGQLYLYNQLSDQWSERSVPSSLTEILMNTISDGTMVWTGSEFILWGGRRPLSVFSNKGARYKPSTNTWDTTNILNAPEARAEHKAVWTGSEMIVWGGVKGDSLHNHLATGSRYNPLSNTWTSLPVPFGFPGRTGFVMEMVGNNVFIWGGAAKEPKIATLATPCNIPPTSTIHYDSVRNYNDGRFYNTINNNWTLVNSVNAPSARHHSSAVTVYNDEIVIAGGSFALQTTYGCRPCTPPLFSPTCPFSQYNDSLLRSGAKYNLTSGVWTAIPLAPFTFSHASVVWDNEQFISYFSANSYIMSFEPSADDWFTNLFPPLASFSNPGQRQLAWFTNATDLVVLPPNDCSSPSNLQKVYNFKRTPITLAELESATNQPGTKLFVYRKL